MRQTTPAQIIARQYNSYIFRVKGNIGTIKSLMIVNALPESVASSMIYDLEKLIVSLIFDRKEKIAALKNKYAKMVTQ